MNRATKAAALSLFTSAAGLVLPSCRQPTPQTPAPERLLIEQARPAGQPAQLTVKSDIFKDQDSLPSNVTALGANHCPHLQWSKPPGAASSVVIIMEDPDAPGSTPFVHWMVANLPPSQIAIPYGLAGPGKKLPFRATIQGKNSNGTSDYFGPKPPPGTGTHRYIFQVLALKNQLNLKEGFDRAALLKAVDGQVLASGRITGTFKR